MEETSEVNKVTKSDGDHFFLHNPCNYCQEFIRAILQCLGLKSDEPQDSSSNVKDNDGGDETSSQGPADPPSSAADPPADPPPVMASLRVTPPRAPPRPPISGGRGPQTNANPS